MICRQRIKKIIFLCLAFSSANCGYIKYYKNGIVPPKLIVPDGSNNRILIWNRLPTINYQAADVVLGQPDFTQGTANNPTIGANTLNDPRAVYFDGTHLIVGDSTNNRVLIWNNLPTRTQQEADIVLGQPDFTQNTANNPTRGPNTFSNPASVYVACGKLIVSDAANNRILIWNTFPVVNNQAADVVLGQPDFTQGTANNPSRNSQTLSAVSGATSDCSRLIATDQGNHRILIWNTFPTTSYQAADIVLGQPDFTSGSANTGLVNPTSQTLNGPRNHHYDGKSLYVVDQTNNRVLIWREINNTIQQAADIVIGQPDFTQKAINAGLASPTSATLNTPRGITVSDGYLYIADALNNRVVIWNSIPTINYQAADIVLGQPDFTQNSVNNPTRSASTFSTPRSPIITDNAIGSIRRNGY